MKAFVAVLGLLAAAGGFLAAQADDAARANALWQAGKHIEALPIYESLAKAHPEQWLYQERLAVALGNAANQETDKAKIKALLTHAKEAAKQAVADKDPNVFMVNMTEMNVDAAADALVAPPDSARAIFLEGEKAYSRGDYTAAIEKYAQAAAADPQLYEAPLYAGDAAFASHDYETAGKWFAKAIAIDPNRETAYRYWADAILKSGKDAALARSKYIEAVVAEPYSRLAWQGLKNWTDTHNGFLASPKINRPAGPTVDPKNPKSINITIDPALTDDKKNPGGSAWVMYSMSRAAYHGDLFKKDFPNEKEYRHTLKEESTALHTVAESVNAQKIPYEKLDESLRNIVELNKAGMLDCWILVNGADQGIAQDYAAYRKEHRQLLRDYLERFVLHDVGNHAQPAAGSGPA